MTTTAAFAADVRAAASLYVSQGWTRDEAQRMALAAVFGMLCADRPEMAREILAQYATEVAA